MRSKPEIEPSASARMRLARESRGAIPRSAKKSANKQNPLPAAPPGQHFPWTQRQPKDGGGDGARFRLGRRCCWGRKRLSSVLKRNDCNADANSGKKIDEPTYDVAAARLMCSLFSISKGAQGLLARRWQEQSWSICLRRAERVCRPSLRPCRFGSQDPRLR